MSDSYVDFRIVKQQISIQAVLDHYGIRLRRSNQASLRGACPLPAHRSETSKDSFGVQIVKNIWACQSISCAASRGGKKGGNIIDFVAVMENCSVRDAALKLRDWFLSPTPPTRVGVGEGSTANAGKVVAENRNDVVELECNKPLTFTLKDIDPTHPYIRSRGLKEETARQFGIGCFPGRGSMSGRCVIPIHNERGELVAYAGRSIDATEPKYKLPSGFKKADVLFNLHRARPSPAHVPVIVVEGFFDCMKVYQAGFSHVVALMGSSMSDVHQHLLSHFPSVIVMLDGDAAGREGALTIAPRLMMKSFVRVVSLPDGMQPDQLASEELKRILGSF